MPVKVLDGGGERLWRASSPLIALLVALPLMALAWQAAQGSVGLWSHIAVHVLPRASLNTLLLLGGVGALSLLIGTGAAWLVTAYDFPGRGAMSWALLLPLAVPTYIVAYTYLDLLHPLGPVQSALRALLGIADPRGFRLPDVRSLGGCIVLMALVLYPYVYLSTRAMFLTQAAGLLEAARTLGVGRRGVFVRVALPLARPAIAIGTVLVLLETLNDIGASEFLGVQTLTVQVYTTWITRSDLPGAAQIALAMLLIVVLLVGVERYGRRRQRYFVQQRPRPMRPQRLRGAAAMLALFAVAVPVVLGFVLPALHLAWETAIRLRQGSGLSPQLLSALANTLQVAALATAVTLAAGLAVAWALRLAQARRRARLQAISLRVAGLGYAIPGTVLAIGLLSALSWGDGAIDAVMRGFGHPPRLWLMGTAAALVLAYALRFLVIAIGSAEAGLARISPSLDQAARGLGRGATGMLAGVHLPLLKPALAAAALLVFVDAMKELPATLMLRPLGFETLATWLYADAARGAYEEGAIAALLIVLAGLLPVVLLARTGTRLAHEGGAA